MRKIIPVDGHQHLVRDAHTGAILNINSKSIQDARLAKQRRKEEKQEIEKMKSDIEEIKKLLQVLVNKNG